MSTTTPHNPIGALNPISDVDAARSVSSETIAELAAAIARTPVPTGAQRRARVSRPRPRAPRPALVLAGGACAGVALVLGAGGVLTTHEHAQSADAAILSAAAKVLQPPGAIVIQSYDSVQVDDLTRVPNAAGYTQPTGVHSTTAHGLRTTSWHETYVSERPTGTWRQNWLLLGGRGVNAGEQEGEVNGNDELYDPATNTVYVSSTYGSDITPGSAPGSFTYTLPTQVPQPVRVPDFIGTTPPPPLSITAQQAAALRDGTAEIQGRENPSRLLVTAPFRTPSVGASVRADLGALKVAGTTSVEGRKARRLLALKGTGEYDVQPGTSYPIREVVGTPGSTLTHTWSEYRVLPATTVNQKLLSLAARHPGARVDRDHADYLAALARQLKTLD